MTTTTAELRDLDFRLTRALSGIERLADQRARTGRSPEDLAEVHRLHAEASSLRLTLSYLRKVATDPAAATEAEIDVTGVDPEVVARMLAPLADPTGRSASSTDFTAPPTPTEGDRQ